jgi:hypothetical protein
VTAGSRARHLVFAVSGVDPEDLALPSAVMPVATTTAIEVT